ncbi:MAG: hypothetical protein WC415_02140 [Patescibacteria group bacterium]|jgi:hypothetical protein
MLEFLQKYNSLSDNIKKKVSSAEVLEAIEDLESRYSLPLANLVVRAMIKDFPFVELAVILEKEFKLDRVRAATLEAELRARVFKDAQEYLALAESPLIEASPFTKATEDKLEDRLMSEGEKIESNEGKSSFTEQAASLPSKVLDLDAVAEEISHSSGITFASSELAGRLRKIILTYLKGIRTKAEAREGLLKSVLSGGLSLEEAEADRVLAAAQNKKEFGVKFQKSEVISPQLPQDKFTHRSFSGDGAEYDLAAELKKKEVVTTEKIPSAPEETIIPIASVAKERIDLNEFSAAEQEKAKEILTDKVPENKEAIRALATPGNKKKMDDIGPPQVMSPIDELAYMDLINFRRLGNSPQNIGKKIKSVVDLLAREGINKQLAGIQAWRRSPVNRTYLSIGQESITEGKDIDAVIADRKIKNLNYLTREEFEAVMDLNNQLRF